LDTVTVGVLVALIVVEAVFKELPLVQTYVVPPLAVRVVEPQAALLPLILALGVGFTVILCVEVDVDPLSVTANDAV
jgi:hypothetical protein